MEHIPNLKNTGINVNIFFEQGTYVFFGVCVLFFHFSLTVEAVPHECVIRTGQPLT